MMSSTATAAAAAAAPVVVADAQADATAAVAAAPVTLVIVSESEAESATAAVAAPKPKRKRSTATTRRVREPRRPAPRFPAGLSHFPVGYRRKNCIRKRCLYTRTASEEEDHQGYLRQGDYSNTSDATEFYSSDHSWCSGDNGKHYYDAPEEEEAAVVEPVVVAVAPIAAAAAAPVVADNDEDNLSSGDEADNEGELIFETESEVVLPPGGFEGLLRNMLEQDRANREQPPATRNPMELSDDDDTDSESEPETVICTPPPPAAPAVVPGAPTKKRRIMEEPILVVDSDEDAKDNEVPSTPPPMLTRTERVCPNAPKKAKVTAPTPAAPVRPFVLSSGASSSRLDPEDERIMNIYRMMVDINEDIESKEDVCSVLMGVLIAAATPEDKLIAKADFNAAVKALGEAKAQREEFAKGFGQM